MCGGYTGEFGEQDMINMINEHESISNERAILMNDLVMLIEAEECYTETYYNSEYKRMVDRIIELGGLI
jgi:ribosomal protein L17